MGNIKEALKETGITINNIEPHGKVLSEKIKSIADDYTPRPAPSGKINITNTNEVDVSSYATAQIVDSNLLAENIKKDVAILGITGSYEGSGGTDVGELLNGTLTEIESNVSGTITGFQSITSISLPNATSIGSYAFQNLWALESVNLPNVLTLETGAFFGCEVLVNVNMPRATFVGWEAFSGCEELESINLPNVIEIEGSAFVGCTSLESITLGANQVCSLGGNAFAGLQDITIYVPSALIEDYKIAQNWSTLYNDGYITFEAIAEEAEE